MKKRSSPLLNAPYMLWCLLFVLVPMGMVVFYAFSDRQGGFTLEIFRALTATAEKRASLAHVFGYSMLYALAATAICLLLAYPLAYFMAHSGRSAQRNLMLLIMVPMWMNFLICTYSWRTILNDNGVINSLLGWLHLPAVRMLFTPGAVILGMVYNFLPYMALPIFTVMQKLSPSLVEAAQDLGATGFGVLRKVTLPMSLPGIASGITMVFVPSVSTFYISQKLGGSKTMLIGDLIEMQFLTAYDYNTGAALSLILMLLIVLCMMVMKRFSDGSEEGAFVV
ncbi:MAG: ABC transporter permease [Oscillospiraceae bacterium]|jgi:spermidine/putrescine transport system permease protein|nr:ABC transporter permease [Oscillospiraceae bacterium]